MFVEFKRLTGSETPINRIVEWGCGGGANALHFAGLAGQYVGVDISQESLRQCADTVHYIGIANFLPVGMDAADPESVIEVIPSPCELFLCTFVFELLPTPEYGKRILSIARQLLGPDFPSQPVLAIGAINTTLQT